MNRTLDGRLSSLDAAYEVLREAGEPLHYAEICRRMLQRGLWRATGKTPEASVNSRLAVHIKTAGENARFIRTAPGVFDVRRHTDDELGKGSAPRTPPQSTLSFTDAAEYVLVRQAQRRPMHYREITEQALAAGVLASSGRTPEATMYSQIHAEVQRQTKRGEIPRFTKPEAGFVGLSRWLPRGVVREIEAQNQKVRTELHQRLLAMDPIEFEALVARLLGSLGFEEVELTPAKGDGGIDVGGTLVVGEVIRTRMAVQVKRWKHNVRTPVIQQVRGSLGAHEQGLIITTSGFSPGAREEAERADATPVALMDGSQLVSVLIENDIGVRRDSYDLLELEQETDYGQCPD